MATTSHRLESVTADVIQETKHRAAREKKAHRFSKNSHPPNVFPLKINCLINPISPDSWINQMKIVFNAEDTCIYAFQKAFSCVADEIFSCSFSLLHWLPAWWMQRKVFMIICLQLFAYFGNVLLQNCLTFSAFEQCPHSSRHRRLALWYNMWSRICCRWSVICGSLPPEFCNEMCQFAKSL